jgi:hypothetical protein
LQYAESQLPQQGESIAVQMAVAFTARIMQTFAAEADAYLDEYGFDEEYLVKTVGAPPGVRVVVRARAAESLLYEIGRVVLARLS